MRQRKRRCCQLPTAKLAHGALQGPAAIPPHEGYLLFYMYFPAHSAGSSISRDHLLSQVPR
jgi:hypothetical protein